MTPIIRKGSQIERSFVSWINNFPESHHPCDDDRFYCFVKTVCRYGKKKKGVQWLRSRINEESHRLSEDDIEFFCDLFEKLQKFHKTPPLSLYEIR